MRASLNHSIHVYSSEFVCILCRICTHFCNKKNQGISEHDHKSPQAMVVENERSSPQPLGLINERPLVKIWEQFPVGSESFWDFRVVHLWVLLGHLPPLSAGPHHESIHGSLDMVASFWSGTHHALLLEEGPKWTGTRLMKPCWALLAQGYCLFLVLQLSWILDLLELKNTFADQLKTLKFLGAKKRFRAAREAVGALLEQWRQRTCHPRVLATIPAFWLVGQVWASDAIGWRTMGGVVTWSDWTMGRLVTWNTWINEDLPAMRT